MANLNTAHVIGYPGGRKLSVRYSCLWSDIKYFSCPYRRSRGIAPLILNLDNRWKWVVHFKLWLLYSRDNNSVGIEYGTGWAPEPVCLFWTRECQGFEPRTVQPQPVATPTALPRLHYEVILLKISHALMPQGGGSKEGLTTNWIAVSAEPQWKIKYTRLYDITLQTILIFTRREKWPDRVASYDGRVGEVTVLQGYYAVSTVSSYRHFEGLQCLYAAWLRRWRHYMPSVVDSCLLDRSGRPETDNSSLACAVRGL